MIQVVNVKTSTCDVFIGRPSRWGNPFVIGKDGTRVQVVMKYQDWVLKQKHLMNRLHELKDKRLGCFCAPRMCHGDVLKELCERKVEVV